MLKKSKVMCIKLKWLKNLCVPDLYIDGRILEVTSNEKSIEYMYLMTLGMMKILVDKQSL